MVKRPTIKDVAQRARVSIATVSFVLNDRPGQVISDRVKKNVWKAAEQLSYYPSATAAGLARKRTHNLAIVFYRDEFLISNQFYSFVVQGAIKEAIRANYNVLFSFIPGAYRGYADMPKIIREKNAEGAIFIHRIDPQLLKDIQDRGVPVVTVDHFPPTKRINTLQIDNRRGGQIAGEHLLGLGHRNIALLYAAIDRPSIAERAEGFEAAIVADGLRFSPRSHLISCQNLTYDASYPRARQVLARKRRPTGLFCANDEMAAGALRAAHELGLAVPQDLSIVGFDDISMSNYTHPPLTTIGVDKDALGSRAVQRLIELVEKGDASEPPKREVVPVRLVERSSTTRAPSSG